MGYARHTVDAIGGPFLFLHEQIMLLPEQGRLLVDNTTRKLIFLLQGECLHRVLGTAEDADIRFRAGDILVLPHACRHEYRSPVPGQACRLLAIRVVLDPACIPPLSLEHSASPASGNIETSLMAFVRHHFQGIRHLPGGQDALMRETLGQAREEAQRRLPGYRLRVRGLCTDLVTRVARQSMQVSSGAATPEDAANFHVNQAREYLLSHLNRPLRLGQVAAHVQISEEHLARLFKRATGRTVFEYVRQMRFEQARDLLVHSDKNIGEIAALTGFASLPVFSRTFHRDAGMSPSDYRRYVTGESGTIQPGLRRADYSI